jgi:putative transposase
MGEGKVGVAAICRRLGMSRQNYYAGRRRRARRTVDGDLVAELVRQERKVLPRLGGRKLYWMLQGAMEEAGVQMGRDRMFEELRERGLLVPALPRQWPQTTRYNPTLPVFHNRIKELVVTLSNEVWVADLTYVRTDEGFLYVSLITDKCSRKIVGYHGDDTLETTGPLKALEMALGEMPPGAKPIHHSDRGCQYCSHEYVGRLQEGGLLISMTEEDHCAQNAMAERINGILKQEFGLGYGFKSKALGRSALKEAVHLYNTRRPHTALNYQVPSEVHARGRVEKN